MQHKLKCAKAPVAFVRWVLTAWMALCAVASAQEQQARVAPDALPAPSAKTLNTPLPTEPDYLIGLEDVLHISVWEEPELTTTVAVRTDGKISLPLINDIPAAGFTPMHLAAAITQKLSRFVEDPQVTVVVTRMKPEKIYMVGQVLHAGPLSMTPNMTVLEALVTAGFTPFANTKKIYVLRSVNGVEQKLPVNYKRMIKGDRQDQNIILQPHDVIIVP